MAQKKEVYHVKPLTEGKKNIIAALMDEYHIETADDIQEALRDLLGGTIKSMMEAEMTDHLGYLTRIVSIYKMLGLHYPASRAEMSVFPLCAGLLGSPKPSRSHCLRLRVSVKTLLSARPGATKKKKRTEHRMSLDFGHPVLCS